MGAGRPKTRQGTYETISLEVRDDLLKQIDASGKSRREYIEEAVESVLVPSASIQDAMKALDEEKVVLADLAGRRVTINSIGQAASGQWFAFWSHRDFPDRQDSDLEGDEKFIIRGKYGKYI
jgi:hypothetical protein